MTEIFITDIRDNIQAEKISGLIQGPGLRACFDLDETGLPFPCGHTILKVEGDEINPGEIIRAVRGRDLSATSWKIRSACKKRNHDGILENHIFFWSVFNCMLTTLITVFDCPP